MDQVVQLNTQIRPHAYGYEKEKSAGPAGPGGPIDTTCIRKNKGTIYELTLNLFLRQLKSIWMSIIVNSRISSVFALMKCCFAAFGEQNKIDNDSKCQQVYKSQK